MKNQIIIAVISGLIVALILGKIKLPESKKSDSVDNDDGAL